MFSRKKQLRRPRIAFIHPAVGKTSGGSQVFVLEMAQRLKDRCDVTILSAKRENDLCKPVFSICRGDKKDKFFNKLLYNFVKKYASTPDIVIEHISSFIPVLSNLLFGQYDVIFPNNDWGGLLAASIVRGIKGTPILFTEHNGYLEKGEIASRNLKFKPDKYIALSNDFKIWVKKHYPDIDVQYIPNGVDIDKFNPDIEAANIPLPGPIILIVSRYQPNKRLELAIQAVSRMKDVSLLILSSGSNLEMLNQKGKMLLGERFKIMNVPYHKIASYYRACDVFTLPSEYEPFGLAYLEAMACNKPVVAPNDLSRSDIIGKAGILCDVRDIDEYSSSLEQAINLDFGDIPFNQAQNYTWERCAEEYYQVIERLAFRKL